MPQVGEPFSPYKKFTGIWIPEGVFYYQNVSAQAKLLLGRLYRYAGKKAHCFPSQETLAQEFQLSDRQIRRYLTELEEAGFIRTQRQGMGAPNSYEFLWHECFEDHPSSEENVHNESDIPVPINTGQRMSGPTTSLELRESSEENARTRVSPSPTADADEPLIDYLHGLARHGRQKPVFNPKELSYLRERDSPEMRATIAEQVEASDAANIREVILAAVGYTGRKAPERKGYNRAAPRLNNGLSRPFEAPRTYDRAPLAPRRESQPERTSARVAKRLGITE